MRPAPRDSDWRIGDDERMQFTLETLQICSCSKAERARAAKPGVRGGFTEGTPSICRSPTQEVSEHAQGETMLPHA